jgi:zinc transport system ATP-binding protein
VPSSELNTNVPPFILEARDVRVSLQGHRILHGIDIAVAPGEVVALMGGNGSGKSTLVRALVGAIPTTAGSISLFNTPASAASREHVGYVPQRITAAGGLSATALEVVTSGLLGRRTFRPGRGAAHRAREALATLGVEELASRDVASLSGGQAQRVLIARALVRQPRLLILDEPMAGVDLQSQVALAHALGHLKEDGVAILLVLHELGALKRHIDRAVVLEQGCVTYEGTPPEALGVHALPGHDHEHAHENPDPPFAGALGLEGPR